MHECSKAVARRLHDARFATRWFIGDGIDVGAGGDSLGNYREFFPGMRTCRAWDLPDGDAQLLEGVADESLDFVHSSHCLRVLEPGGDLVVIVPDEDLHEQGVFPSTFNTDHKWTFTIAKFASWSPRSVNVTDLMNGVSDRVGTVKIELLDASYRFAGIPRMDQTLTPVAESAIEIVARKWTADDLALRGRIRRAEPE